VGPVFSLPLVRWDGAHLVLDLALVEERLNDYLGRADQVRKVNLRGAGDNLRLSASLVWKGRSIRVALELTEIRLRHRRLGFRVRKLRVLGGVPVPRTAVGAILRRLRLQLVTAVGGRGIVIVDLSRWIPPTVTLTVLTVQLTEKRVHLWLGPGELQDVAPVAPALLGASAARALPP
jgi:hypothetical protein